MQPHVTFAPLRNKNLYNQDKRKGFYKYSPPPSPHFINELSASFTKITLSMGNTINTVWYFRGNVLNATVTIGSTVFLNTVANFCQKAKI